MTYFTINELCLSATAEKHGIKNIPGVPELENLTVLVNNLLDPIREAWGKAITVNSGYRCTQLNSLVGGVTNSHHIFGYAADITVGGKADNKKLFALITSGKFKFTQAILEKGGQWIHISYIPAKLKCSVLYS
jgi:hypothetical protein